ncbi:hypothetical protein SAMN06298216_2918 [Spirosomataceae bacterium TFI 002]|nr:hypothetical protein SAMN06298216_2918 [Spirosomataceae bacterium TFI 002]
MNNYCTIFHIYYQHRHYLKKHSFYSVETSYRNDLVVIRPSEPYVAYFSNLSLAYKAIESNLAMNGWPLDKINYTGIYRLIKQRGIATITLKVIGSSILTIKVSKLDMNNPLEKLGIDAYPLDEK